MNGMRRFLAAGLSGSTSSSQSDPPPPATVVPVAPLVISGKPPRPPSTPPLQLAGPIIAQDLSESPTSSSPKSTASALFRQDKQHPPLPPLGTDDDPSNSSFHSLSRPDSTATSFTNSLSQPHSQISPSSSRILPRKATHVSRKSVERYSGDSNRISSLFSTREELLISLLASEAVVDSRGFEILSSEQVEDLKKVRPTRLHSHVTCIHPNYTRNIRSSHPGLRLQLRSSPLKVKSAMLPYLCRKSIRPTGPCLSRHLNRLIQQIEKWSSHKENYGEFPSVQIAFIDNY
jgi:Up-regulated During Septation